VDVFSAHRVVTAAAVRAGSRWGRWRAPPHATEIVDTLSRASTHHLDESLNLSTQC
jgi:hypothetical protein